MGASDRQELEELRRLDALEKKAKGGAAPLTLGNLESQIPGHDPQPKQAEEAPASFMDKVMAAGDAGMSMVAGIPASVAGTGAGIVQGFTGGKYGTPEGVREAAQTAQDVTKKLIPEPRTDLGKKYLGNISEAAEKSGIAALPPVIGTPAMGMAGPAAKQAGQLSGRAAKAIGASPEAELLRSLPAKAKSALTPKLDPETVALAQKAEKMGIKVPPDMLTDNGFMRVFGNVVREVPLSGGATEANRMAFNRAIIKTIGGDVREGKITPKVFGEAMTKHGEKIGEISAKHPIAVDAELMAAIQGRMQSLSKETPDVARVITGYIDDIGSRIKDGKIDGETWRKLRSELGTQMRASTNGDLKRALGDLEEVMLDAVEKNLNPTELKEFTEARNYYYNGKLIEPLVAKAAVKGAGDMSPAAYATAISSGKPRKAMIASGKGGEPVDISAVGSKFLTEPNLSNAKEKAAAYGAMSAIGGGISLPAAAAALGGANLYNRLGPLIGRKMIEAQKK